MSEKNIVPAPEKKELKKEEKPLPSISPEVVEKWLGEKRVEQLKKLCLRYPEHLQEACKDKTNVKHAVLLLLRLCAVNPTPAEAEKIAAK